VISIGELTPKYRERTHGAEIEVSIRQLEERSDEEEEAEEEGEEEKLLIFFRSKGRALEKMTLISKEE
jgi:hypothetical protein